MRVLALDTTSVPGSAALAEPGRPVRLSAPDDSRPFGERLPNWLLDLLREAGVSATGVDLFVVGAGPGSLTGLRVGIATMQGLSMSTGRPLVAVSALEALAHAALAQVALSAGDVVAAWSNARRSEVFAQLFGVTAEHGLAAMGDATVGNPAAVAAAWAATVAGRRLVGIGDAVGGIEGLWTAAGAPLVATLPPVPLAGVMARLGEERARLGEAGPPHAVRPLYIRRPDAEVARERAAADEERRVPR